MRGRRLLSAVAVPVILAIATGPVAGAAGALEEARQLAGAGRLGEALERLESLPEAGAGEPQARFLRGVLLAELGRSADAIDVFDALTEDFPRLAEPFNNLAVLYAAEGRYNEARDALLVAIENNPSYGTAHENLGDIYAKMAGLSYERALELDAANASARDKRTRVAALFDAGGARPAAPVKTVPAPVREPLAAPRAVPAQTAEPRVAATTPGEDAGTVPVAGDDGSGATRADAVALARRWAADWSAQDPDRYLSHYAPEFEPADGSSRASWERTRRARLVRPSFIAVSIDDVDVETGAGGGAWVTFEQSYSSDNYRDSVRKRLDLVRTATGWKIAGERTLP